MNFKDLKSLLEKAPPPPPSGRGSYSREDLLRAILSRDDSDQLGLDDYGYTGELPRKGTAVRYRGKEPTQGFMAGVIGGIGQAVSGQVRRTGYQPLAEPKKPSMATYDPAKSIKNLGDEARESARNIRDLSKAGQEANVNHDRQMKELDDALSAGRITAADHKNLSDELVRKHKINLRRLDDLSKAHKVAYDRADQTRKARMTTYGMDRRGRTTDFRNPMDFVTLEPGMSDEERRAEIAHGRALAALYGRDPGFVGRGNA